MTTLVFLADQFSKWYVSRPFLNRGISFAWGSQWPLTVTLITTLVAVGVTGLTAFYGRQRWEHFWWSHAIFVGAVGSNLADRWWWGAVRDIWRIPGTALYNNLADWLIFLVIIFWIGQEYLYDSRQTKTGHQNIGHKKTE